MVVEIMKIILISPDLPIESDSSTKKDDFYLTERMYPYSLVYLSNYLIKHGYKDVKIIDLCMMTQSDMLGILWKEKPDVIGVTGVTRNRFHVLDIMKRINKISGGALKVVGGPHFSYTAKQTLLASNVIDVVVRGEGEETLYEIVKTVEDGKYDFKKVLGLSFLDESGDVVETPNRPPHMNLDDFAIDFSNLPSGDYNNLLLMRNWEKEGITAVPMQLGRGCKQGCVFCINRLFRHRNVSIETAIKNIESCIKKFNTRSFSFNDPSLLEDKDFVVRFCDELLKRKLNIKWYCEARADTEPDLLKLMAQAGCISLDWGLETSSPKVLKVICKGTDVSMFVPYAKLCKENGIRTKAFVMVSLPGETEEDALMTYETSKKVAKYIYRLSVGVTQILPGSVLEQIAINKGLFPEGFDWYDESYDNNVPIAFSPSKNLPMYFEHLDIPFVSSMLRKYSALGLKIIYSGGYFWKHVKEVYGRSSKRGFVKKVFRRAGDIIFGD